MNKLSMTTCVSALNGAAMSRKAAFQVELAVGLAVFMVAGEVSKDSKSELCEAYASAGYQCIDSDGVDYKTVNRRINVTADLFNVLTLKTVKKWAGRNEETTLIDAIVEGLKPYELLNVSDVQRYCEPPATKHAANDDRAQTAVKPDTSILQGPSPTPAPSETNGHTRVINMFRRAADQLEKEGHKVQTEHLALIIPKTVDRDELIAMATQLLALVDQMKQPEKLAA
jgi:hypothetical protein